MKLPNATYANDKLSPDVEGTYQIPDFIWAMYHEAKHASASVMTGGQLDRGVWCECVGEGKPSAPSADLTCDHALRQAMFAGAACLYHQISLNVLSPSALIFTINGSVVRFFLMAASFNRDSGPSRGEQGNADDVSETVLWPWHITCQQLDTQWNLQNLQDCFRLHGLSVVLERQTETRRKIFNNKWSSIGLTNQALARWWIVKAKKTVPATGSKLSETPTPTPNYVSETSIEDNRSEGPSENLRHEGRYSLRPRLGSGSAPAYEAWEMHAIDAGTASIPFAEGSSRRITGLRKVKRAILGLFCLCFRCYHKDLDEFHM
jgi:hypothetical protein